VLGVILGLVVGRGLNIMPSEKYELLEKFPLGKGDERFLSIPVVALVITPVEIIAAIAWLLISFRPLPIVRRASEIRIGYKNITANLH
jgi:hypothetical protein